MILAAAAVLEPPEEISPSAWAESYRVLCEEETDDPGPWSNDYMPCLAAVMDACEEALRSGRDVVIMKPGQGCGSQGVINVVLWAQDVIGGPILYLISKDEVAKEFVRERFKPGVQGSARLKARYIDGYGSGTTTHVLRFAGGKIVVVGGQSVLNLESLPYPIVVIDEIDSLQSTIAERGDLVETARNRTDQARGDKLIVALAHPTTGDRGAGKLYYTESDQRRPHVTCCHCGELFWMRWDHVVCVPSEGETLEKAQRVPQRYVYVAPCCGAVLTDGERIRMARRAPQVSVLAPSEAASKGWIGLNYSQLFYPHKTLLGLARRYVAALDDPSKMRVWRNKVEGDVYEQKTSETTTEQWRSCVVVPRMPGDPEAYRLGQVPPGVRFLTAGQDSRTIELHWCVWGWGLVRDASDYPLFCGWLIDAGVVRRDHTPTIDASDLTVFDGLLYDRGFPRTDDTEALYVLEGLHDSGWCPTAVYEYCLRFPGRAIPTKGGSEDDGSTAPLHRWGGAPRWKLDGQEVSDPNLKQAILNTYIAKEDLFGLVGKRFVDAAGVTRPRIALPVDVADDWLEQSSSEYLTTDQRGKKTWAHKGPNHWSDCNVQAFASGRTLSRFQNQKTRAEVVEATERRRSKKARSTFTDPYGRPYHVGQR